MGKKLPGYCTDVKIIPEGIMVTMPVEYWMKYQIFSGKGLGSQ